MKEIEDKVARDLLKSISTAPATPEETLLRVLIYLRFIEAASLRRFPPDSNSVFGQQHHIGSSLSGN